MSAGKTGRNGLAALLLAGASSLCLAGGGLAQDMGLRGNVSEAQVTRGLIEGEQTVLEQPAASDTVQIRRTTYKPASPGAVPDDNSVPAVTGRPMLVDENAAGNDGTDTGGEATQARPLPPSTARARTLERRASARQRTDAQQTAATGTNRPTPRPGDPVTGTTAVGSDQQDELSTGTVRQPRVDSELDLRIDPRAERVDGIEDLDPKPLEENPYLAPGIRAGAFLLRPSIETGIGWTSNSDYSPGGQPAWLSETTLRLNAESQWAVNKATLDAFGTFRKSIAGAPVKETNAGATATLQLDLGHEYRLLGKGIYARGPESASSPVNIVGTLSRPIREVFTGSAALMKDAGKFQFGVTGAVEYQRFGDADLSTGGSVSQRDRNSVLSTVALRGGYEISPALTPFAEVEVGRRLYEQEFDAAGYDRSANRLAIRGGVGLDLGEKLTGEVKAGWLTEKPDDARLASISGFTLDGDLNWSPVRGTIVSLNGQTLVEGTTTPGETGSILYSTRLNLERQMRANLTGNLAFGAGYRDYAGAGGHDWIYSAEAGATWWFNRYVGLTGRARYEALRSTLPNRDSQTTSVFAGIKLQR